MEPGPGAIKSLDALQRPAEERRRERMIKSSNVATILSQATAVLGSREAALEWLQRPAIGLDQHRPVDFLDTPEGTQVVAEFLERVKYGVYT